MARATGAGRVGPRTTMPPQSMPPQSGPPPSTPPPTAPPGYTRRTGLAATGRPAQAFAPARRTGAGPLGAAPVHAPAVGRSGAQGLAGTGGYRLHLQLLDGAGLDGAHPGYLRVLRLLPVGPPDAGPQRPAAGTSRCHRHFCLGRGWAARITGRANTVVPAGGSCTWACSEE